MSKKTKFIFDIDEYFQEYAMERISREGEKNEINVIAILQKMIDDSIALQYIEIDRLKAEIARLNRRIIS